TPSTDYLRAICEQGASEEALEKIDAALICFDSAQIYTLHSFCYLALKEFAFEAKVSVELADPDEKGHLALLEQTIKEHLKETLGAPHYSPAQIHVLLKRYKQDIRKLLAALMQVVCGQRDISSFAPFHELHAAFVSSLHALPQHTAAHWMD